ncbi:hypothetical protein KKD52_16410 [Myxococcota bacterium]|nr:hypothetical protein [Myxococcota bacterium]MBU1511938.1 hypothetical protein [Myxococcota bacterium]
MNDEIRRKIGERMQETGAPVARLPGWVGAALLSAGLALPVMGCCLTDGPAAVYAGPPVRDPETRPQPPPEEPADKQGGVADPAPAPAPQPPEPEDHPLYGVPN